MPRKLFILLSSSIILHIKILKDKRLSKLFGPFGHHVCLLVNILIVFCLVMLLLNTLCLCHKIKDTIINKMYKIEKIIYVTTARFSLLICEVSSHLSFFLIVRFSNSFVVFLCIISCQMISIC